MILIALIMFLLLMPQVQATDYQELSIERRQKQLKDTESLVAQPTVDLNRSGDSFEEEKRTISQQLAIITGDEDTKYTIVPGDTLQIAYSDQGKTVENIYQLNSDGAIAMPLIGNVKVSGMNRGQARDHINDLMSEYIRNPQLNIKINNSGKYTVVGAAGPGVFELQPNINLLEALLKAGIDQHRANLSDVLVMRAGRDKPQILRLNIKKMMIRGDRSDNIAIKPNDLIYVPNSFFFDFDTFKDKMFSYLADYYTLGGATILKASQSKSQSTGAAQ